jgi:hypothetical protein
VTRIQFPRGKIPALVMPQARKVGLFSDTVNLYAQFAAEANTANRGAMPWTDNHDSKEGRLTPALFLHRRLYKAIKGTFFDFRCLTL